MWYCLSLKRIKTKKYYIYFLRIEKEKKKSDLPSLDHIPWYKELKTATMNPDQISVYLQRVVNKLNKTLEALDSDSVIKIKIPGIPSLDGDNYSNKLRQWSNTEFLEANKCLNCGKILDDDYEYCDSNCMKQDGKCEFIFGDNYCIDRVLEDY